MPLSKEKMREYQRQRRQKVDSKPDVNLDVNLCKPVNQDVSPVTRQEFEELRERVKLLESAVSFLSKPKVQSVKQVDSPYSRGAQASGKVMLRSDYGR